MKYKKMNLSIFLFFFSVAINAAEGSETRIYKKTNGFDQRVNLPKPSPVDLYRITKYFEKKQLLDKLKNPQIPIHVKTQMTRLSPLPTTNIFAGGLMKDFLFDMDE